MISDYGFYRSSVPSFPFWWMSSSKRPTPDLIMGRSMWPCSIGVVPGVFKWSKIGLQEFRIRPEVRAYYAESRLYRMSEDGVYSSSVPSCPFWGMSSSKRPVPDPIFAGSRCPVIELECFLVWSNWSKIRLGIPNPSRSLNLG